jgi:very-short-patch-repair endonuclease
MHLAPLQNLANTQNGLVSLDQARALGISSRKWSRLHASGHLQHRHNGVSSLFGFPSTYDQRALAATLALGGVGIASHRTAAYFWNAWTPGGDEPIDIIIPDRGGGRSLTGVNVHRPRDRHDIAPIRLSGVRVTTATRTLLDLGAIAPQAIPSVTERMLIAGSTTREHLRRAVALHSERGRAGIGPMRKLLESWPYADRPADSVFELRMDRLLMKHQMPRHQTQIEVGPFRIDLGWPEFKVAGELDGWGKYERLAQFRDQARRDSYLQIAGWIVVHFTWHEVTRSPRRVIHEMQRALRSRGWSPIHHPHGVLGR